MLLLGVDGKYGSASSPVTGPVFKCGELRAQQGF
jgi:hypothetical protein